MGSVVLCYTLGLCNLQMLSPLNVFSVPAPGYTLKNLNGDRKQRVWALGRMGDTAQRRWPQCRSFRRSCYLGSSSPSSKAMLFSQKENYEPLQHWLWPWAVSFSSPLEACSLGTGLMTNQWSWILLISHSLVSRLLIFGVSVGIVLP